MVPLPIHLRVDVPDVVQELGTPSVSPVVALMGHFVETLDCLANHGAALFEAPSTDGARENAPVELVGMLVVAKASVEIADGLLEIVDEGHVGLRFRGF